MKGIISLALLLALVPAAAAAQTSSADHVWDVIPFAGVFLGRVETAEEGGYQEDWFEAAQGGVAVGRYLSPHLKLQLEGAANTEGTRFVTRRADVPNVPSPFWITSEERTSVRSAAATVVWQFRDNELVHPFVEAGLQIDRERLVTYTPEQFVYGDGRGSPPRVSESRTEETVRWQARPLLGGGAKLYFREHAFVRTDGRLTFDGDRQYLSFRFGVGLDF